MRWEIRIDQYCFYFSWIWKCSDFSLFTNLLMTLFENVQFLFTFHEDHIYFTSAPGCLHIRANLWWGGESSVEVRKVWLNFFFILYVDFFYVQNAFTDLYIVLLGPVSFNSTKTSGKASACWLIWKDGMMEMTDVLCFARTEKMTDSILLGSQSPKAGKQSTLL